MAGALHKTMVYLGLAEEDERYDSYDQDDEEPRVAESREERRGERSERRAEVTPITRGGATPRIVPEPATDLCRITTIHPRTYNEAKKIGESFRDGVPVIMNLGDMDDADAKRLVDFSAGLVFGLHGAIERVTAKVFLLSPAHVEVTAEEQQAVQSPGLFNQS